MVGRGIGERKIGHESPTVLYNIFVVLRRLNLFVVHIHYSFKVLLVVQMLGFGEVSLYLMALLIVLLHFVAQVLDLPLMVHLILCFIQRDLRLSLQNCLGSLLHIFQVMRLHGRFEYLLNWKRAIVHLLDVYNLWLFDALRSRSVDLTWLQEIIYLKFGKFVEFLDILVSLDLNNQIIIAHAPIHITLLIAANPHLLKNLLCLLVDLILENILTLQAYLLNIRVSLDILQIDVSGLIEIGRLLDEIYLLWSITLLVDINVSLFR